MRWTGTDRNIWNKATKGLNPGKCTSTQQQAKASIKEDRFNNVLQKYCIKSHLLSSGQGYWGFPSPFVPTNTDQLNDPGHPCTKVESLTPLLDIEAHWLSNWTSPWSLEASLVAQVSAPVLVLLWKLHFKPFLGMEWSVYFKPSSILWF